MLKSRVQIKQGTLQGTIEESNSGVYVSFKGIPYAKPPLGNLRFADPQAPEPWDGVKDAIEHADICLQKNIFNDEILGSEDCLYLNVYTPNIEGEENKKYPVMIFIHGGAFKNGSGNSDMYGPEYIVDQKVLLVTVNYRLEAFGFLCLDTEEVPGNAGLKDQVAAIKWVKENISNFGGDSDNITIFGGSSGSACVTYHLFSPLTKGLFHAAIAQSGVCTANWALDNDGVYRAFRLGKLFGKNTTNKRELLEFLRSIPPCDLVGVTLQTRNEIEIVNDYVDIFFVPVIEKENIIGKTFLSTPINDLLTDGKFHDVPLIIGFTSGEGIVSIDDTIKKKDEINKDFNKYLTSLTKIEFSKEFVNRVKQFYLDGKIFDDKTLRNIVNLRTDLHFSYSIFTFAMQFLAGATSSLYFYTFDCLSELNFWTNFYKLRHLNLTCHGDDLFYLFKSSALLNDVVIKSPQTETMIKRAVTLWTNFAKHRKPTIRLDELITTTWEPVSRDNFNYLEISNDLKIKQNPIKERIDFWDQLLKQNENVKKL